MKKNSAILSVGIVMCSLLMNSNLFAGQPGIKAQPFFETLQKEHPSIAQLLEYTTQKNHNSFTTLDQLVTAAMPEMTQTVASTVSSDGTATPTVYTFNYDHVPALGPDLSFTDGYGEEGDRPLFDSENPNYDEHGRLYAPHSLADKLTLTVQYINQVKPKKGVEGIFEVERVAQISTAIARKAETYLPEPNLEEVRDYNDGTWNQNNTRTVSNSATYLTTHSDGSPDQDSFLLIDYMDRATERLSEMKYDWTKKLYLRHMISKNKKLFAKYIKKAIKRLEAEGVIHSDPKQGCGLTSCFGS